jgi:rubrerythrin
MPETSAARHALRRALERASLANRLLLHLALRADAEGRSDLGRALRDAATGETGRAFEHLDWLERLEPPLRAREAVSRLLDALTADAREEATAAEATRAEFPEAADWLRRAADARVRALERLRGALAGQDRGA